MKYDPKKSKSNDEIIDLLRKALRASLDDYEQVTDLARRKIAGEIDHVNACLDIIERKSKEGDNSFAVKRLSRLNKLIIKTNESGKYKNRHKRMSDIEKKLAKIEKLVIEILGESRR